MVGRLRSGTLLADTYRIVRLVGCGGMGEVYEATHDRLAGKYAVKVLLADLGSGTDVFQRFRREAEVTSSLRHPNIVHIVDFNVTPEGNPYLVMEFLEGTELSAEIRRVGAMPVDRALNIVRQIASALMAAHAHKIVHRDLKPQNIFLLSLPGEDREVVKVVDFGISKVREATTQLTRDMAIIGTPQYMAPEQALGKVALIDERTDQFALGAIAYELLTGWPSFHADNPPAILYQVVHEHPQPMQQLVPSIDPAVTTAVSKALSKAQEDRFPTVLQFYRELERAAALGTDLAMAGSPMGAAGIRRSQIAGPSPTTLGLSTGTVDGPASRTPVSRRGWALLGVASVVVLGGIGFARWRGSQPAQQLPSSASTVPKAPDKSAQPTQSAPEPKQALVEVDHGPPELRVVVDGKPDTLPVSLPFGPETHLLEFSAPGFYPTEVRVDGLRERRSLVLAMKAVSEQKQDSAVKAKSPVRPASHRPLSAKDTPPPRIPEAVPAPGVLSPATEDKAKLITDF